MVASQLAASGATQGGLGYAVAVMGLQKEQMKSEGALIMSLLATAIPPVPAGLGGIVDISA